MHAEIVQYAWSHCSLVVAASFSRNVSPLAHVYYISEGGSKETCCGKLTGGPVSQSYTFGVFAECYQCPKLANGGNHYG